MVGFDPPMASSFCKDSIQEADLPSNKKTSTTAGSRFPPPNTL